MVPKDPRKGMAHPICHALLKLRNGIWSRLKIAVWGNSDHECHKSVTKLASKPKWVFLRGDLVLPDTHGLFISALLLYHVASSKCTRSQCITLHKFHLKNLECFEPGFSKPCIKASNICSCCKYGNWLSNFEFPHVWNYPELPYNIQLSERHNLTSHYIV